MLPYAELKETIKNLRLPDGEILKRGQLAPLAKRYDAYPVHQKGRSLCVLIPIGQKPAAVSLLDESQLSARIIVLANDSGKWAKVWPLTAPPAPAPAAPKVEEKNEDGLSIEFVED